MYIFCKLVRTHVEIFLLKHCCDTEVIELNKDKDNNKQSRIT